MLGRVPGPADPYGNESCAANRLLCAASSVRHSVQLVLKFALGAQCLLSRAMVAAAVYIYSRELKETDLDFFGLFTTKAFYLPWISMMLDLFMDYSLAPHVYGILSGHAR